MPSPRQRRKCKAHLSSDPTKPCGSWARTGTTVCNAHGARAPRVAAAAAERRLDVKVRRALATLEVEPCEDPLTELSKLAGVVLSWKDAIAERVNELTSVRYSATGAGTEQLRAEVALFERALDRCASVLGLMARLDIDGRMARISERQAEAIVRALDAGLAAAGISGPAAQQARQAAARELRVVQ